ncbi:MAG: hypothetical protein Q9219_002313 [cf. Caloplaca sp. 3 TL-2023]
MHPPISNAVQGAFVVAAFVTGLIFGGGSIVFADVTEGMGCLLGGYSLAMWFLVLIPGGLIKSTADLNDDVLPLHYSGTYPMTRGIRVEIAAIIILFLLGVMSQMKIWQIVKRRREQRAAEHLRQEQLNEQAEEDLGRKIEEGNERDRATWEATYNGKGGTPLHVDSGIGTATPSTGKVSLSVVRTSEARSSKPGSIELHDLERGTSHLDDDPELGSKGKGKPTVTVCVASDDDVVPNSNPLPDRHSLPYDSSSSLVENRGVPKGQAKTTRSHEGPTVVPLPFQVPRPDSAGDRRSSVAASIASDHFSTRALQRLSGGSLRRTASRKSQRSYIAASTSEEALMISHDDDEDRASSVEAAADEGSDGRRSEVDGTTLAGLPSPEADEKSLLKFSPPAEPHPVERPGRKISESSLGQHASVPTYGGERGTGDPSTEEDQKTSEAAADEVSPAQSDLPSRAPSPADDSISKAAEPVTREPSPEKPAFGEVLTDLNNTSKVVMAYRTNEWAKHLDGAEKPSFDDLRATNPEDHLSQAPVEKVTPVDIPSLQQTPLNALPAPATMSLPKLNTNPHSLVNRSSSSNSQDSLRRSSLQQHTSPRSSLDSLPSQTTPRRYSSQQPPHRNYRVASTPLTHTPIDEDIPSTTFPQHTTYTPPLPMANTLMSRRESMLQTRPSSTSLTRFSRSPPTRMPSTNTLSGHSAKRRSESSAHRGEVEKRAREKERDERWRRSGGQMEERHREAMRRMQMQVGGDGG